MLTVFIRTIMLLFIVIVSMRLMGKRQIGQLQPSELVITILLSEIAAAPMQDNDIPLLNTIISILVLVGVEILLSVVSLKNNRIRSVLQGNSIVIIRDGVLDQNQIKRLRYTLDDIYEALRKKDIFDITEVEYAIAETDGSLSILLKPEKRTVTGEQIGKVPKDNGMPCVVISDGKIVSADFKDCRLSEKKLLQIVDKTGKKINDIFLMTVDKLHNVTIIGKDESCD